MDSERTNINNGFKLDTAEFCGYAKAKLEAIEEDVKDIKRSLSAMRWKVAAIGGATSLVITILTLLVKNALIK